MPEAAATSFAVAAAAVEEEVVVVVPILDLEVHPVHLVPILDSAAPQSPDVQVGLEAALPVLPTQAEVLV